MLPRSDRSSPRALSRGHGRRAARALPALLACALPLLGCGVASSPKPSDPFVIGIPDEGPGGSGLPPPSVPPPTFPRSPVWTEDAATLGRVATFGSFPSDLVRLGTTLFVTDADAVEWDGARVLAFEVGGGAPVPSTRFSTVHVHASDLVDGAGHPGDAAAPVGLGFFLNDLEVPAEDLGFVLANAGGSDSSPALCNLVVFDPTTGALRQVVDLATTVRGFGPLVDSTGAAVPGDEFVQSGAEGVTYVAKDDLHGVLFVAMSNFVFGAPSYGAVKYPGTVQVFDVDRSAAMPVARRPASGLSTTVLRTAAYNPVAVAPFVALSGATRVLVTEAGTTAFDASFRQVPVTAAAVEVFDLDSLALLGRFDLGLAGLAGARPALGRDGVGHRVGFFASAVNGEAYLLRLDGLFQVGIDPTEVAILRGPGTGIPIERESAGTPGSNVAGLALSSDGRTLVVSGYGDLFAFPSPKPGRIYALALPADLVGSGPYAPGFVPGTSNVVTTSGRTLGPVLIAGFGDGGGEIYVAVGGALDPATFLGAGPASIGTLETFGRIR